MPKRLRGFVLGERAGRLVQEQDAGLGGEGLGDLDELLVGGAQALDDRVGRKGQADHLQVDAGDSLDRRPVDDPRPAPGLQLVEHDVLGDRALGDDLDLLADDVDALGQAVAVAVEAQPPALEEDFALVGPEKPGDDLDEGALARAVLADQGVDFARREAQADAVQGPHPREPLADSFELEHGGRALRLIGRRRYLVVRSAAMRSVIWRTSAA